jgi:hypothetical protein
MKERLILNWKTTLIGLGILLVGSIALFLGKVTGFEFIGFITTAIPLLVAKDSLITGLTGGIVNVNQAETDPKDPPPGNPA